MKYEIVGNNGGNPTIAILCPRIQKQEIQKHYFDEHLLSLKEDVMVCDLYLNHKKKQTPAAEIKEYLNDLIPHLMDAGIELLIVTQPAYFKVITKKAKTDATIGDVVDTVIPGMKAVYCPNYSRIFYDPEKTKAKIKLSLESVVKWKNGDTTVNGSDIIKFEEYPQDYANILAWLDRLLAMKCDLTCDIEGFSLKHYDCGVGTITFCWNEHEGVSFPVEYKEYYQIPEAEPNKRGYYVNNPELKQALKNFFKEFKHRMIYHNVSFDVYVLVYQLFMDDILDQEGLLEGLDVMLKNWECTQLISYLATNSCAGNELGLKAQSQAFAGNYAQTDIHDITLIPMNELLKYNLIDGLATWYVYNKNHPKMVADDQEDIYLNLFKPAIKDIIQMQLTGMPINMEKVIALDKKLQAESDTLLTQMNNLSLVQAFMDHLGDEIIIAKNKKLKTKQITRADLGSTKDTIVEFNPNSPQQLQKLLYSEDFLGLPVLDYTDTKLPATGADTLEKLQAHTKDPEILRFLDLLIEFKASAIILSTFLPAFLKAQLGSDGWHYLFGNFRLGGTASGRLSSNNPNLQNIPSSGSTAVKKRLAKLIKECFEAPPGWLFIGLDFDSLEDKISAVTTKDPMKIKVYSDGYDGHCLRALAYFAEEMPDVELCPDDAQAYSASINGKEVFFHSQEVVVYQEKEMTGQDLYDLLSQ